MIYLSYIFIFLLFARSSVAEVVSDSSFAPKAIHPTFTSSHPRVLMDQGHFNLSIEDGRYSPLLGLLKSDGYQVIFTKEPFTSKALKDCEILYISAAMSPPNSKKTNYAGSAFSNYEIKTIQTWVSQGGSLLVMTDHPPSMSDAPEALINAFGIKGSGGITEDLANTVPELHDASIIVFKDSSLNVLSPIITGRDRGERINKIIAFTGQSLQGPPEAERILSFSGAAIDRYKDQSTKPAIGRSEIISLKYGLGRVVVSGDATVFTSKIDNKTNEKFGINRAGTDNVQLALNVFHWLSQGRKL